MRTLRWSVARTAAERAEVRETLSTITFSQPLAATLRQFPAEPPEAVCHDDRACGRTHASRSEAYPDVLEPGISKDPLADRALRLFCRFRRGRCWGGIGISTLPVPRRRTAGSDYRHRLHHLVRGRRAFRAVRSVVRDKLRLFFPGAVLLPRH